MKNVYYFILLLIIFTSCEKGMLCENQDEIITKEVGNIDWKSQLNALKENPKDLLVVSGISLIDYQLVDTIDNNQKLFKYKDVLKEEQDMLPFYNQSMDTIKVLTKKEALNTRSVNQKFTFDRLNEYIDENVQDGMNIIRLTWNNNGTIVNTLCAVSDKKGIVYDCLISNALIFKVEESILDEEESASKPNTRVLVPFTGSRVWTMRVTAEWLWGAERGFAEVAHTGYYRTGSIYGHDCTSHYSFQFGTAKAQATKIGNYTIAYVCAMAAPGITINTGLGSNGYYLDFSGYIPGFTSGDSGSHSFFNDYTPVTPAPDPIH